MVGDSWDSEAELMIEDECGCGSAPSDMQAAEPSEEPDPAPSQKPQIPIGETDQPTLDQSDELPPAPINVPATRSATGTESGEIFPGPAAQSAAPAEVAPTPAAQAQPAQTEVVPPAASATETNPQPGDVADEPADRSSAANEPAQSKSPEVQAQQPESVDELFGEPSPSTEEATGGSSPMEEDPSEVDATDNNAPENESTEQPAADPLDDLFGPSSEAERPGLKSRPFGARSADGLASKEIRRWSGRSSDFICEGRLIHMTPGGVFVALRDGEVMGISFERLSDADLAFVCGLVDPQRTLAVEAESRVAVRSVR